ncbi:hypothetical protein F7725_014079 [Dissostichus mawsoni]|uniref:Uncharacterized protein n=1 Tax=Dissostichus mawsoni TaxID=36200 RepID=A0A7J5YX57_DISMA|nr:hypothetical protein F7725_014079 [Dissostichus mawsoni]
MMCVSSDLSLLPQVLSAYASVVEQTANANQLTTMNSRLRQYCQAFFYGLSVKLLPAVTVAETKCSFRVNSDSHNLQILTGELGVTCYSSCGVGNQAFCIVGITMINLYPKDSWNFVFGQASLSNVHWMEVDQTPEESSTCQSLLHYPKPTEAFQTSRLWLHTCLDILRE